MSLLSKMLIGAVVIIIIMIIMKIMIIIVIIVIIIIKLLIKTAPLSAESFYPSLLHGIFILIQIKTHYN